VGTIFYVLVFLLYDANMVNSSKRNKVFVGLSGGVDSSVSAALLKKAGYDVTGVFIKVWQPDWIECNWKEERRDAMRVAAHLEIPFVTLDLIKEYKQDVIDYMVREYSLGRTPNPDVMCNRYVKFGGFLKWAKEQGGDYVATGHYARVAVKSDELKKKNNELGIVNYELEKADNVGDPERKIFKLLAGLDANKDQSYFLWTLNQKDLPNILFPVGHLTKPEVRKLAEEFGLPTASKKDSQGLCFIGKVDVKEFLSHYIKLEVGNVLNENGEVVGTHSGALLFTKGERHGFEINSKNKTPNDMPFFVIDKDVDQNTITVSNKVGDTLPGGEKQVTISHVNWVSGSVPDSDASKDFSNLGQSVDSDNLMVNLKGPSASSSLVKFPLQARSRYRQPLQKIRIVSANISETTLEFENVQDTLTPGQSLVIYKGEECLGGGVIG